MYIVQWSTYTNQGNKILQEVSLSYGHTRDSDEICIYNMNMKMIFVKGYIREGKIKQLAMLSTIEMKSLQ